MSSRAKSCSTGAFWSSYPLTQGLGDYKAGRYYGNGVPASGEPRENFPPAEPRERKCEECNEWYPLDTMPSIGECRSPTSRSCNKPVYRDQAAGDCFAEKTLEGLEFAWCGTCRVTVPASDFHTHVSHDLFAGAAHLQVEEMREVTLAGD